MTPSREKWKQIQRILGTAQDGFPGPNDERALDELKDAARTAAHLEVSNTRWHSGKASSFADPADIRAFKRCKAQGKSDRECFKVGDNGIGKWGTNTTENLPMVALPPEDWEHLAKPQGTVVLVEHNGQVIRAELQDTMPKKANIKNGAIIDLNPAAAERLGLTPPFMVPVRWRWA